MIDRNVEELTKTAEAYEELLVPAVFEECAGLLAEVAEPTPGQHVLDVACGTGIVARAVAKRVEPGGSVQGVDLNPGMLAVAKRLAPAIEWREGTVEALPYEDETFDLVLCQFAMMFFPAPQAALREMARVLKPNGRMALSVFDRIERQPAYSKVADVYERVIGEPAGDAGRGPFTMGNTDELAALFRSAGISSAMISTQEPAVRFPSVRDLVLAEVQGWFPFAQLHVDKSTVDAVVQEMEDVLSHFCDAKGAVQAPVPIHIVAAAKT